MQAVVSLRLVKRMAKRWVSPAHWRCMSWCRRRFGLTSACIGYLSLLRHPELYVVKARRANVRSAIRIRPGTADQDVYDEVFVTREYDIDGINPRTIIDAGAHIGLTSVMLANRYPDARIVAIEPESSNFRLLLGNVRGYANITPMRAGLWGHSTTLRIVNPGAETWGFRVVEVAEQGDGIQAVSIPQLMQQLGLQYVDVLKIDIEGSEIEVLLNSESWIGRVGALLIELHDRFRPGCAQALEGALAGYTFERSIRGNTVIIRNIRKSEPRAPLESRTRQGVGKLGSPQTSMTARFS